MAQMGSWLASDALHATRDSAHTPWRAGLLGALLLLVNHTCIRLIRVIRGQIFISAFPRTVSGRRDRCAKGPTADRA